MNWRIRQECLRTAINLQTLRSKRRMIVISPRMRKWWVASDLHPVAVRQYFSLLKSRDFTLKVCNPEKSDTKAELNRRSQACDGPDRHRCSRRVKWSVRRVTLPLGLAPEASTSGRLLRPFRLRTGKRNPKRTESGLRSGGSALAPSTVRGLCRQTGFTWESGRAGE